MNKILLFACLLCTAFLASAQERAITGKAVSSEDGSALPGVSVVLKGTSVGTVTYTDDNYRLTIPSAQAGTLVFSLSEWKHWR